MRRAARRPPGVVRRGPAHRPGLLAQRLRQTANARAAVTVPHLYAVLSAVNAGAGYSLLPHSLCQEYLAKGRLTRPLPRGTPAQHALPRPASRQRGPPQCAAGPRPPAGGGTGPVATRPQALSVEPAQVRMWVCVRGCHADPVRRRGLRRSRGAGLVDRLHGAGGGQYGHHGDRGGAAGRGAGGLSTPHRRGRPVHRRRR
ncbi:LysR substrate-binding domain-containing protein [Streptomyces sp. NPDC058295]|uniref:LysR substrate-binding domain-containing protein n=1 Tax=Streptomyces sp. NPDC058295 TaxID=3346431 RepID=UPI0036ECDFE0